MDATETSPESCQKRTSRGMLPLSLRKAGQDHALDHAVIKFPTCYENAITSAHEVFKLSASSIHVAEIELRYPIRKEGATSYEWGRILPAEWLDIVDESTEEIGVFILGGGLPGYEDKMSRESGSIISPSKEQELNQTRLMHLISIKRGRDEDKRFVVPLAESYEECLSVAYECFSSIPKNKKKCKPSSIVLLGKFAAVNPNAPKILAILTTQATYSTYITTKRDSAIEFVVKW